MNLTRTRAARIMMVGATLGMTIGLASSGLTAAAADDPEPPPTAEQATGSESADAEPAAPPPTEPVDPTPEPAEPTLPTTEPVADTTPPAGDPSAESTPTAEIDPSASPSTESQSDSMQPAPTESASVPPAGSVEPAPAPAPTATPASTESTDVESPSIDTPTVDVAAASTAGIVVEGMCDSFHDFKIRVSAAVEASFVIEGSPAGTYTVRPPQQSTVIVVPADRDGDGRIRVVPWVAGMEQQPVLIDVRDCTPPDPLTIRKYCSGSDFYIDVTAGYQLTAIVEGVGSFALGAGQTATVQPQDVGDLGGWDGDRIIKIFYVFPNDPTWREWAPNYYNGSNQGEYFDTCPPGPPSGLTAAVAPTNELRAGQVRLSWSEPSKTGGEPITDYRIERSTNGTTWAILTDSISTATSSTVSGLTNGTPYQFRVSAFNSEKWGTISNVVSVTPRGTPPAATGLSATVAPTGGLREGQVRLAWSAPSSDGGEPITDYVLQHSLDGVNWATVSDGVSTTRAFTISGLRGGASYRFRVSAKNSFGVGTPSAAVATKLPTRPSAPTGVVATRSPGTIRLTWAAPANGGVAITDYVIQRSLNGRTWVTMPDTVSTSRVYTNSRLSPGIRLWYRVIAKNALGTGSPSAAITVVTPTRPSAPRSLTAHPYSGSASLDWYAPVNNGGAAITDYVIQRSTDGKAWTTLNDGVSTSRWSRASSLSNGRRYYFRVAARNALGIGPFSAAVGVTPRTVPGSIPGLRGSIRLQQRHLVVEHAIQRWCPDPLLPSPILERVLLGADEHNVVSEHVDHKRLPLLLVPCRGCE